MNEVTRRAARALTIVVLVLITAAAVAHLALGWSTTRILTGSMTPYFSAGDVVLTRETPTTEVVVGDVAVFVPPGESAAFAHRVTTVEEGPYDSVVITTRGDANPVADPYRAVLPEAVPVVRAVLPTSLLPRLPSVPIVPLVVALGLTATVVAMTSVASPPSRCACGVTPEEGKP